MKDDNSREVLDFCNHKLASALLLKQFAGGVIPKQLGALLDLYLASPSTETATKLIEFDQNLISVFQLSRQGGTADSPLPTGDSPVDVKTIRMLEREPDFEKYCLSVTSNPQIHKQLKEQLHALGYSEEVIDDAFGEYWNDAYLNG